MQFKTQSLQRPAFKAEFDTAEVAQLPARELEMPASNVRSAPTDADLVELDALCTRNVIHNVGRTGN